MNPVLLGGKCQLFICATPPPAQFKDRNSRMLDPVTGQPPFIKTHWLNEHQNSNQAPMQVLYGPNVAEFHCLKGNLCFTSYISIFIRFESPLLDPVHLRGPKRGFQWGGAFSAFDHFDFGPFLFGHRPLSLKIPNVKFDFDEKFSMYLYMLTKCSS